MKKMTHPKYRTILEAKKGEIEKLIELSKNDSWKPSYHIHHFYGLVNDPNGLCQLNGEYHVFYQWYPFGTIHGMKHWAHVKSKDLVNWKRMPVALIPTEDYESHGAYSGGALIKDNKAYLYYTGNIMFEDGNRNANQCLAIMDSYGNIEKFKNNPLIKGVPKGYTGHVRDPKVWEQDGKYYMILGAQRKDIKGVLIIYESKDAVEWKFKGELKTELTNYGYMWECPDYFRLNGKDILVFSSQGLERDGHNYQNIYNVVYVVGKLDIDNLTFQLEYLAEIDKGFDFYAPQSFKDETGRRILFAWAGMGEMEYPTDKNGWAHCLTIPRELKLEGNTLKQIPVKELERLRINKKVMKSKINSSIDNYELDSKAYELDISLSDINSNFKIELFKSEKESFKILFNKDKNEVVIDRSNFENSFGERFGETRSAEVNIQDSMNLKIYTDNSIVELFINDGEIVFTSRVFPLEESNNLEISSKGSLTYKIIKYDLKRGIL
ncbi:MAG: sucrose-6-phosphate hydrolase [Clostridium thermopalmarium]|uniref:glycoside hydrolase family 32 protein n=1 Tax=Clostridium thermopalmarium TaxID=29373 RepID=UPI002353670E|nr:sucrose-6-phosphate hydrolase [Clostridium thermopalmarium]MBE6044300.1 sucrose-6-phosphate hydrolase [Clostridium thermopalmarium]